MAFPLALALPAALSLIGGTASAARRPRRPPNFDELLTDPTLQAPDPSMLAPQADPAFLQAVRLLNEQAGGAVQAQLPQLLSSLQARGFASGSSFLAPVLARAFSEAQRGTLPGIAQLLAQQGNNNLTRYLTQLQAAQRARLLRAQLKGGVELEQARGSAQQQAGLTQGLFQLGGQLVGAGLIGGAPQTEIANNPGVGDVGIDPYGFTAGGR